MLKMIILTFIMAYPSYAQVPTVVYGASEQSPDKPDSVLVIQPENSPNPLGNPIPDMSVSNNPTPTVTTPTVQTPKQPDIINQNAEQNPQPFSQNPAQEKNQIENTLYQGGNRIYDVQSFPLEDVNKITEPNIDPTITTYPEY